MYLALYILTASDLLLQLHNAVRCSLPFHSGTYISLKDLMSHGSDISSCISVSGSAGSGQNNNSDRRTLHSTVCPTGVAASTRAVGDNGGRNTMVHEPIYSTSPLSRGENDARISGATSVPTIAAYCSRHPTPVRVWGFLCSVRLLPKGHRPLFILSSHRAAQDRGLPPCVSHNTEPGTRHLCVTFLRASKGTWRAVNHIPKTSL